jgi:putative tricarboxylic transport membrane protein
MQSVRGKRNETVRDHSSGENKQAQPLSTGVATKRRMGMEKVCGVVVFCLGLAIIWLGRGLPFGSLNAPGPGFFPLLLACILIVLSIFIFITRPAAEGEERAFTFSGLRRVGGVFLALIAYQIFLESLGFALVSFLLMAFFFVFIAKYVWYRALLGAFLSTALAYLLFEILLQSNLPKGVIGF